MNKQELKNYFTYHPPGGTPLKNVKRNVIFISNGNSIRHELAKALGAIMVHKWGDVKFSEKIIDLLAKLEIETNNQFWGWAEEETSFLTEAVPNNEKNRRVDLVNLRTKDHIEFETNSKIKKENATTIYLQSLYLPKV